ncbi:MAG: DUF4118 domain-containing protein [Sphingobacteriales bacterium]|nr:MAG: DUF4118 domain-containing protein [Sphingobacteriales bacterium]
MLVCFVSVLCFLFSTYIEYRVIAFLLLVTVSVTAVLFDILPVLLAAVLSALIWDFFFIPPHFTFRVGTTEDFFLLLMYFVIALVNAVLTHKIRRVEKIAMQKEEKAKTVKLYNTLLNSLSHELKTPIATIIGATDNLQTNNVKLTPQNRHDLVQEISKATVRLNQQVENLLNMSRLDSGFIQPKKEWSDISEVIYDAVKRIEENGIQQQLVINVNPSIPLFKLDEVMLEQIIYNLLNNAVQYTPSTSRIDIMAINHADVLQVVVEDEGAGFPEAELKKVFNKFYRLKNAKPGGTGLGLSIVKGFTEAMGGIVSLENRKSGGAKFIIEIPAETSYLKNLKNE